MQCAIELKNVTFSYEDGARVLGGVTASVGRGDFFCVIGDNGTGKSTLLKIIVGLLAPTGGSVSLPGAGNIAYVSQRGAGLWGNFPATAEEIVSLGLAGKKAARGLRRERSSKVALALSLVGMGDKAKSKIGALSGGQRQRVIIAKALVSEPDTLVLDEPTVGVDREAAGSICCLLGELNKQRGITVIMVTHDMPSIVRHATKILDFKHNGDVETFDALDYERTFEH